MKKPLYVNNGLREYCNKTTNESIRKLTEKYNLERKTKQHTTLTYDEDDSQRPNLAFFNFFIFLSITTATFYFYKRLL